MLTAIVAVFRARPRLAALLVVSLMGSSLLYQSTSAFGEALAASVIVGAVLAGIRRRPLAIFVLVQLASLGKETLAPFVVLLVLACARTPDDGLLPAKRLTAAAIAGGAAGLILNAAFNVFRFGSIRNLLYFDPPLHTAGVSRKIEFFAALFASPSAGVLWFWPLVCVIVLGGTAIGIRRLIRSPRTGGDMSRSSRSLRLFSDSLPGSVHGLPRSVGSRTDHDWQYRYSPASRSPLFMCWETRSSN